MEVHSPAAAPDVLIDPPAGAPVVLDGVLERARFPAWLMALVALVAGWMLLQVIGSLAAVVLLLVQGVPANELMAVFTAMEDSGLKMILLGNTVGQVAGLAALAVLLAWMHSSQPAAFLRLRRPEAGPLLLGVLGLFALQPAIQLLGSWNETLPLPDWWMEMERAQLELIEKVLLQDLGLAFTLGVLAVTPALCEELLFRGYVQRQLERAGGVVSAIVLTGLVFGLYHMRITQLVPLALLGTYLAYLTWRTGSLWPAIVVHFANNAFAVAIGAWVASDPERDLNTLESISLPWYLTVGGTLAFIGLVYVLHVSGAASTTARRPTPDPERKPDPS